MAFPFVTRTFVFAEFLLVVRWARLPLTMPPTPHAPLLLGNSRTHYEILSVTRQGPSTPLGLAAMLPDPVASPVASGAPSDSSSHPPGTRLSSG